MFFNQQGENEVQGHLFLTKLLPGLGRKVNDSYDEFKQIYLTHPKGMEKWKQISEIKNILNLLC